MSQGVRVELYKAHEELEDYTYNIKFAADTQRALMNSLYAMSLKTSALILFSEVHYLSSSSLIYLFAYFCTDVIRWISLHSGEKQISRCFGRNVNIAVCADVCSGINDDDELTLQSQLDTISPFVAT